MTLLPLLRRVWLGSVLLTSCAPAAGQGRAADPILILVALDGFHPSYLERASSRHLRELARDGVRARWMVPVFPTLTFPNFYSIATGLYPEHHGIVSNKIGRASCRERV